MFDLNERVADLVSCRSPYLIGVRHHSAVMAAAMPLLLDKANPDTVLIELPTDLQDWIPWLASAKTQAPVALALSDGDGEQLAFYPFADFSPELVAMRWAHQRGIPIHAIDVVTEASKNAGSIGVAQALCRTAGTTSLDDAWERMVETPSYGADPERVRRAALAFGLAMRKDTDHVSDSDLFREAHMRQQLRSVEADRPVAVVGAFHCDGLLSDASHVPAPAVSKKTISSLISYSFAMLDSRSGYPAGVKDPAWHQAVIEHGGNPDSIESLSLDVIARVCADMRDSDQLASTADVIAAYTMSRDLAVLRGFRTPGRAEVVQALQSSLSQGEPLGRARAVAAAAENVLVGRHRGVVDPDAPRCGLSLDLARLRGELRLPAQDKQWRLDPFRSDLDQRRHITLNRMTAVAIQYGSLVSTSGIGGTDAVGRTWSVSWSPRTDATIEVAGMYGASLAQAAAGAILRRSRDASDLSIHIRQAAECGFVELTTRLIERLDAELNTQTGLSALVDAYEVLASIKAGSFPGIAELPSRGDEVMSRLLNAAVADIDSFKNTTSDDDIRTLARLLSLASSTHSEVLVWRLGDMARDGSALVQGAANAALQALDEHPPQWFADQLAVWADHGGEDLAPRFRGALIVAAPLLESSIEVLEAISERIAAWDVDFFLARLPGLRDGFSVLSVAARDRFLATLGIHPSSLPSDIDVDLAGWSLIDQAAFTRISSMISDLPDVEVTTHPEPTTSVPQTITDETAHRWRLILGRQNNSLPATSRRWARALDELYGYGHGEGSHSDESGGTHESFPTARVWGDEISELFGDRIREEVMGHAAINGRSDVLTALDPERVTASVELLESVLSLTGAMPASQQEQLRRLANRIISELTKKLASELRPSLTGIEIPRVTRRPAGRLDLAATLRRNLHTARLVDEKVQFAIENPLFRTRGNRSASWHIHLIVDTSGSMERSVIYSALTAAVLHGVPALSINFTAFSTDVVDFTDKVNDPLSLLLEVNIGGGTNIGKALAYTRQRLTVPSRSIVALISDFEEGHSVSKMLSEIRALAESGATLLGLAALGDGGIPVYEKNIASQVVNAGMPVAALSPTELASWIAGKVNR